LKENLNQARTAAAGWPDNREYQQAVAALEDTGKFIPPLYVSASHRAADARSE